MMMRTSANNSLAIMASYKCQRIIVRRRWVASR